MRWEDEMGSRDGKPRREDETGRHNHTLVEERHHKQHMKDPLASLRIHLQPISVQELDSYAFPSFHARGGSSLCESLWRRKCKRSDCSREGARSGMFLVVAMLSQPPSCSHVGEEVDMRE